jgi:hypothetical protein
MDILTVKPSSDFALELHYSDGTVRRFDMKPLLGMKPWNRIAALPLFMQARAAYGTVVWPGEIDIAPETLMLDSVEVQHLPLH